MTKAITDFTGYAGPDLAPVAQAIHDGLAAAAAAFPAPPVPLTQLQAAIEDFQAKLAARNSRATADIVAFNVARHQLEGDLGDLGAYVNLVAKGNPTPVTASGFPAYETTGHGPDTAPPPAPTNVRLRQGDLSGSLVVRYRPGRDRSLNEVQTCLGDPNAAAAWQPAGMFSGGKATLSGLAPGAVVWVRVRTAGLKGVMGAWSDPAKLMVV